MRVPVTVITADGTAEGTLTHDEVGDYIELGPVLNPDGSPSDVTKQMLEGTGRSFTPPFEPTRPFSVVVQLLVVVDWNRVDREYGRHHSAADLREWVRREAESATESALRMVEAEVSLRP